MGHLENGFIKSLRGFNALNIVLPGRRLINRN